MEYVGRDEDGQEHVGWVQDQANSCGPACVYMVEANTRRACLADGETRIRQLLSRHFSDSWGERFERWFNDFNDTGINVRQLHRALNAEGFRCKHQTSLPAVSASTPFPWLAHIDWPTGGGHFVVITRQTSLGRLVCLDPWYGFQQVTASSLPNYGAVCGQPTWCSAGKGGSFSGHCIVPA